MCGRFTLHSRARIKLKGFTSPDLPFEPRYNIAPSQEVLAIADFGGGVEARLLRWGLIPSWSMNGQGFINARSETLAEKRSFSEAFRLRRCLIPADGFFEWKRKGKEKRPFYIRARNDQPLTFAGIWDTWRDRDAAKVRSCAIITTAPNELVRELHDRMPVILSEDHYEQWVDRTTNPVELMRVLTPFPAEAMTMYQVSQNVNSIESDVAGLIEPVDAEIGQTMSLF